MEVSEFGAALLGAASLVMQRMLARIAAVVVAAMACRRAAVTSLPMASTPCLTLGRSETAGLHAQNLCDIDVLIYLHVRGEVLAGGLGHGDEGSQDAAGSHTADAEAPTLGDIVLAPAEVRAATHRLSQG